MNLPNKLTCSRLVLTLAFLMAIFVKFPFHHTLALVIFLAASLTDYWDGRIARREGLITNFGTLMDPVADKILVCSAFIAFVGEGLMPAWMVVVVVARELAITGLRLLAASKNVVLSAERYGKHKTLWQVIAIISILVFSASPEWQGAFGSLFAVPVFGQSWVEWMVDVSKWMAVAFTGTSGALYLWRNRELYLNDL